MRITLIKELDAKFLEILGIPGYDSPSNDSAKPTGYAGGWLLQVKS